MLCRFRRRFGFDTHFEVVDVRQEEAHEAESDDPLTNGTGHVDGVVLEEGHR